MKERILSETERLIKERWKVKDNFRASFEGKSGIEAYKSAIEYLANYLAAEHIDEDLLRDLYEESPKDIDVNDFKQLVKSGNDNLEKIALYYKNQVIDINNKKGTGDETFSMPKKLEGLIWEIANNGHDLWAQRRGKDIVFGHDDDGGHVDLLPLGVLPQQEVSMDEDPAFNTIKFILESPDYNLQKVKDVIKRHSSQAAATAIMARNLSHNIGSHVIAYWIGKELTDQLMRNDLDESTKVYKIIENSKKLFQYLQHRMDFLAEISSSVPSSELDMDFVQDLLKPLIDTSSKGGNTPIGVPPLLKYIAFSEHLGTEKNGLSGCIKYDDKTKNSVSIPNGYIGAHAFYTILENFIRNAAKHHKGKMESNKSIFEIKLTSANNPTWEKNYFEVRVEDLREGSCSKEILEDLVTYIDLSETDAMLTDEEGKLNPKGWGFKEMLICANFLRKRITEDLLVPLTSAEEPPLLALLCNGNLCYESNSKQEQNCNKCSKNLVLCFYLRKPKHLLMVDFDKCDISTESICAEQSLYSQDKWLVEEKSHRLIIYNENTSNNICDDNPKVTPRLIPANSINGEVNDEYYISAYEKFIRDSICTQNEFPFLFITGGGEEGYYEDLFSKPLLTAGYGAAKAPEIILSKIENNNISNCAVFYHHAEDDSLIKKFIDNDSVSYFQPLSTKYSICQQAEVNEFEIEGIQYQRSFVKTFHLGID